MNHEMAKNLKVVSPAPRDTWRRIYEGDPDALVSQSPDWVDCICTADHYRDSSRLFTNARGQQMVLPTVRHRWAPGPLRVDASMPVYWETGGPIGDGSRDPLMLQQMLAHLASETRLRLSIRPNAIHASTWRYVDSENFIKVPQTDQSLDLSGGLEALERTRFRSSVRRGIKKAAAKGVEIEHSVGNERIGVFYGLYEKSIARWAAQQREPLALSRLRARLRDPRQKLEMMARQLADRCHVWVARYQGLPAAAIIVLQEHNAQYIRGAMDKDLAGKTGVNFWLHYKAIEDACRAGCGYYHMGESRPGSPLAHFKSHFGAEIIHYEEYRHERLPVTKTDRWLRRMVKALIGFRDY